VAPEVWSILVLGAYFALGTIVRINKGALAPTSRSWSARFSAT
jgi:hypothetical protein